MDKKLVMYELRRHGEDEVEFYDIEDLFFALMDAGFQVERHFYEDGEFSNEEIQDILSKEGLHSLPIVVMDEKVIKGRYPTLDEVGHYFNIEISYQPDTECCCGEDDCCCCGGHAQEDPEYEGCGCHHHEDEEHECCCHHHEEEEHEYCCHHDHEEEEHECCCCHHEE